MGLLFAMASELEKQQLKKRLTGDLTNVCRYLKRCQRMNQALLRGAQQKDKRKRAEAEAQEILHE